MRNLKPEPVHSSAESAEEERKWREQIDPDRLPQHIAVIMDGNGRWAQRQGLPRLLGHRAGAEAVRRVIEGCRELKVPYLTLYTFSAENWRRPPEEVQGLMGLIEQKIREEIDELDANQVRVCLLGRMEGLPSSLQEELRRDMERTKDNTGLTLFLALNYGGRLEIVDAARRVAQEVRAGHLAPEELDEETFAQYLYAPGVPDPELLIRTGGEMRVSNFLLWQIAYAELWVTPVLWPDFTKADLYRAVYEFQQRDRRFGGLSQSNLIAR
ncbi:MAG TPA: isoprenyl transferase [Armatimonadetes bacterium]|nr:isoprenyl transferase [Armatimonadota bacterium]